MLYSKSEIQGAINRAVTTANLNNIVVNGFPVGTLSDQVDIKTFGDRILSRPNIRNPFMAALYQEFIYRASKTNIFKSPFDYFRERRDGVGFGSYETNVQPIFPVEYDMKAFDRILDFWETPAVTQYFAINRKDTFPQTLTKDVLKQAFASYEAFDEFLAKLIMAPRLGNTIMETNAVKMTLNANIANGVIKTRTLDFTNITEAQLKALAAEIVGIAEGMSAEPSTEYNNFKNISGSNGVEVWAQSDRRDLVLIGETDIIAKLRTYVLAFAMHNEEIDFIFHFIPLNTFDHKTYDYETREFTGVVTSPVKLLLCDGGFIKLEDNLDYEGSDENVMTMGVQRALQVFQTIDLRVDRNALAWLDSGAESDIKMKDILYIEPPYVVDIANGETVQKSVTMAEGITKAAFATSPYQSIVTKAYLFKSFADSEADHVDVTATVKEAIEGGNSAYNYPNIAVPAPLATNDWIIDYNHDAESGDDFALGTDATLDRLMVEYEIVKLKNPSGELVPNNYTTTGYKVACVYKNVVS
jgi:hypothetical protein